MTRSATWTRLSRGIGVVAAVTVVTGMWGPGVAVAAPSPTPVSAAVSADDPLPTREEDKIRALAALGLPDTPDMLRMSDRNFVIALWEAAKGKEVRAAAEDAFAGTDADCTAFIVTGVHEANKRDQETAIIEAAKERAARQARSAAAAVLGIVAGEDLLVLSNRDFVYAIWQRATGERVKAAALAAFGGTEADQQQFIDTGLAEAHNADRLAEIEEQTRNDEKLRLELLAREARLRAAAVLGIVASEGMLALTDQAFVVAIWEASRVGSEVRADAEKALHSADPAKWRAYIDAGIHEAAKRDLAIALQKKTDEDRRRAEQIVVDADKAGQFILSNAARTALKGSPSVVDDFLRVGQWQLRLDTGLEAGQVQPTWTNSPNVPASVVNVIGHCCNLTAPELGVRKEKAHAGSQALMYSGKDNNATRSFAYLKAFNLARVTVRPTTKLSYWIFPESTKLRAGVVGTNSTCVAVDLLFGNKKNLRDSGAKDQRGYRAHPAHQCKMLKLDTWNEVVVPLGGVANGQTVTQLHIGYDQPAGTGGYRGYVDDIKITH